MKRSELKTAKRKDPKKVTIRASHAKAKPRKPVRPTTVPSGIVLPEKAYDRLYQLSRWLQMVPEGVELGDDLTESIWDEQASLVPEKALPANWYVDDVQVEDEKTCLVNGTEEGDLVALCSREDMDPEEAAIVVLLIKDAMLASALRRR